MNSKKLARVLLALPMLLFQSLAADKISQEKLDSQGKQRTYYLMVPDSAKAAASVLYLSDAPVGAIITKRRPLCQIVTKQK